MTANDPWQLTPTEAREEQRRLATRVCLQTQLPQPVRRIAGVDCGFADGGRTARAAAIVMDWPTLELVEERIATEPTRLPYIPGLLSFRELPVVLKVLEALTSSVDLILSDGQGIAHPRRLGIAAHLGVVTGKPAIGVAKSRLTGSYEEPARHKGAVTPLVDGDERIGSVVRSRDGVKPLFISPGHRVNHDDAVTWVLACCRRYRLPEPVHAADRLASNRRRG